jgi:C-terminal processing protease CtpA/Prc
MTLLHHFACPCVRLLACALALGAASLPASAQPKPIGFSLQVSTDGILSPKVVKAVIGKVQDDSQARAAGLAVGDELIKVEGIEVPGNGAFTLKPHMEFVPGKPKRLMFKRADGSTYEAILTKPLP